VVRHSRASKEKRDLTAAVPTSDARGGARNGTLATGTPDRYCLFGLVGGAVLIYRLRPIA
jgi:hypothetical protein